MASILSALGIGSSAVAPPPGLTPISGLLPWQPVSPEVDAAAATLGYKPVVPQINSFFQPLAPRGELWDKLMPYRLVVVDVSTSPVQVVQGSDPSPVIVEPLGNGTLAFSKMSLAWEFFLPITPQQLSITDNYSINTSATLRGILEEHSGVRFKNISVQGTFGVWPGRPAIVNPPGTPSVLQSIFGGTIAAAQNVATQFTSIINNITTGSNASKPVTIRPGGPKDDEKGFGTGYYQTIMLTQFLEQYAEAKRNPVNAGWRLVFDIPKQNQSFVVTPVGFTWNENVNKPMEIDFSLQFKAWRRIDLNDKLVQAPLQVTQLSPGILQTILNTIQAAQNTAAAAVNLIGAVRSDVDNILNIIRQTGLLVKGIAGIAVAASDLPAQLVSDTKSTISTFLATLTPQSLFGPASTDPTTVAALAAITALAVTNEGLSTTAVANGQLGSSAVASATLNPSNVVFKNPLQYPLLFGQVPVSSLTLNSAQQTALQNEINTVSAFTVANLKTMRATIQTLCSQLANSFGAGDAYYSALFNLPTPTPSTQPMNLDDFDILESFYALLEAYDLLTATNILDNNQILNNMEYVSALAATSNIAFSIPNSKIQVPVPYGLTIEQIAMRYLGDPQLWIEIATLNNLQEPYIDEIGFQYPLLSNADGRNVVIGSDVDLFIGQTIYLYANTQAPTARTLINIVQLSQTSFLLTLDGLANLDTGFTLANQAYIQAYLPGTVNSQNVIWVPSNITTVPDDMINIPASVASVDLVGLSKVDWLLTPQGDLATTNSGDFRLAAGIPNLIQALSIKLGTQLGTSLLNPDFGLSVRPGAMVCNTSAGDIYNEIEYLIEADPRFDGISGLQVNAQPPSVGISLGVQLAGQQGVFPVSFQLPTGMI
jgi:hypothetical protein